MNANFKSFLGLEVGLLKGEVRYQAKMMFASTLWLPLDKLTFFWQNSLALFSELNICRAVCQKTLALNLTSGLFEDSEYLCTKSQTLRPCKSTNGIDQALSNKHYTCREV